MPVARNIRFHCEYAVVMRALDRLDTGERDEVKSAVGTLFSSRSDYTDIKLARACIERIAQKYSG
jgi:hypothetical protein